MTATQMAGPLSQFAQFARLTGASWDGWIYPLPTLADGRAADISDDFSAEATADHRQHLGVDLMYRRLPSESAELPRGTKLFYMPANTPVVAAYGGKIWSASVTGYGHSVTIDHGNVPGVGPAVTFYQHMASFSREWRKGDVVRPGDVLGIVGGSLTGYPLHHLHFELRLPTRDKAIDPKPYMAKWARRRIGQLSMPSRGRGISMPLVIGVGAGLLALGIMIASAGRDELA